jgi:hypothetical protein
MLDNSACQRSCHPVQRLLELGLKETDSYIFNYANSLVIQALEFWAEDRGLIGYIRKAASRLDELIYGPQVPDA